MPKSLFHIGTALSAIKELGKQFWTFYAASFCFDFGMFIFFFLYNLYLLDLGFGEKFLGQVVGAMAAGSIAGTLPAGWMAQRIGLRRTLFICFSLVCLTSALRALFVSQVLLLGLAFLGGAASCIWAVCISPALAQLTNERNRPFGFSLVFSFGIGEGALGGLVGGGLPGWLARIEPSATPAHLKQTALLMASGIVAIALWPISRLNFTRVAAPERRTYARNPFVLRFLIAIGVWSLVTGAFSPFFNVYFARNMQMPIARIGMLSAASQLSQVAAILIAPFLFKKYGLVTGIMYTQIAAALGLAFLGAASRATAASPAFVAYMAFQWMSEPGMCSLLMNRVTPAEQSGASALNFLVISIASAVVAPVVGAAFAHYGYPPVLMIIAAVALLAAILFRWLLGENHARLTRQSPAGAGAETGV